MLFGTDSLAPTLLTLLNIQVGQIPRYRDAYWKDNEIVILTRTGGGNRDEYDIENHWLTLHPNYIRDQDDDFDCTYAEFFFSLPEKFSHLREWLDQFSAGTLTPGEKWTRVFEALDKDDPNDPIVKKMNEVGKQLSAQIEAAISKKDNV